MIKIHNKSDEKISFETDMSVSMANAIRRHINEIPILAIDSLEISKNDSALYDEIIAHRAGLIPLKNEKLILPEDCECNGKGCGKCSIKFKLKAVGPCMVYATDLVPKGSVEYKMPFALLDKEQELEFVAVAKMGRGIDHAKFSPGLFFYRYCNDEDKGEIKKDDENFAKIIEEVKNNADKEINIFIESWGQMKAKEIFVESVKILEENLKEFLRGIK